MNWTGNLTSTQSALTQLGCGYLRGGVEGVPGDLGGEVVVTVVHTNRVDLLFVALNAVGGTDVVTEQPGLVLHGVARKLVRSAAGQQRRAD